MKWDSDRWNEAVWDSVSPQKRRAMQMFNVSISRSNAEQVIALLKALKKNITDNPTVFTNATAILAQIEAALTELSDAHDAVVENDSLSKSLVSAQQSALADCAPVVADVGAYGEDVCADDKVKAALLGLPLTSDNSGHTPIPLVKQTGLSVTTSETPGELDWQCDSMDGAHGWEAETGMEPLTPSSFTLKGSFSRSKGILTGLPSNTKVWVRVRATGGKNVKGPWSDPIARVVS